MTLPIGKGKGLVSCLCALALGAKSAGASIQPEPKGDQAAGALTDEAAQRAVARARFGQALGARLELRPIILDYELPGHPLELGRGHNGALISAELVWRFDSFLKVYAGALGRLPFSQDFTEEAFVFPLLAVVLIPFPRSIGDGVYLRFGTLNTQHGFHRAILDEPRYAYGRNYEETYNRALPPEAQRDIGRDLLMPVETGAQLIANLDGLRAELYLDWQLLETERHREKFAVGLLGSYTSRYLDAGFQLRLVHYGGQLFTQRDPIRRMGLDPKRQPLTLALSLIPKPLHLSFLSLALPITFLEGRLIQQPGQRAMAHRGLELGLDATLFSILTLGYRFWLPGLGSGFEAAYLSEDGDPAYSGPRSHRATIGLIAEYGLVSLNGRLDLIFVQGSNKVQYQTVTALSFVWEPIFWEAHDER